MPAVRRRRRDQHRLAVLEVAESRMRDQQQRFFLLRDGSADPEKKRGGSKAKHGLHENSISVLTRRSAREPRAFSTNSLHMPRVSARNSISSVTGSTNQPSSRSSFCSWFGAQPEKPVKNRERFAGREGSASTFCGCMLR